MIVKFLKEAFWFVPASLVSIPLLHLFVSLSCSLMLLMWACGTVFSWSMFGLYVGVVPRVVVVANALIPPFISVPAMINAICRCAIERNLTSWRCQ